jgi:hypothetical protein
VTTQSVAFSFSTLKPTLGPLPIAAQALNVDAISIDAMRNEFI